MFPQMQQQSLAQVQQYTAALCDREVPKVAVLPDNMKPSPKKQELRSYQQRVIPEPLMVPVPSTQRPATPPAAVSPVPSSSPSSDPIVSEEVSEEVVEDVKEEEAPAVKHQAEKRKYNERTDRADRGDRGDERKDRGDERRERGDPRERVERGDRESRPYRGGRDQYRMDYNSHGYDGFNGYGNDYGPPMHRGGYRGGYPPRYPPPHRGMYRGGGPYPRGPPRGHPDHYRGRGRPRY